MLGPSGEQFEIAFAEQRAVAVEVGGGIRTYSVDGEDVLDGYGVDEMASGGRGQLLIPWPNRLQDGSYEFEGRAHQLPLTEPNHSNAIHGLVRWVAWRERQHEPHRVVLEHVLHPQPGYPFSLELQIEYELSTKGLTVRTTATNIGAAACPYGSGAHPYLTLGAETVDDLLLQVPASTALRSDDRGIPVGRVVVEGTELDFRSARRIGETKLDTGYTDLERDDAGVAPVSVETDGRGRTLWVDEGYPYVMVFTGDIPAVQRRGLAVEPMTCPPNAFRSGEALVTLEPEESHTATWGLSPTVEVRE
ncbi:MAG: aldose 1-epimerase family protein [Gaiellaceae bacterium]